MNHEATTTDILAHEPLGLEESRELQMRLLGSFDAVSPPAKSGITDMYSAYGQMLLSDKTLISAVRMRIGEGPTWSIQIQPAATFAVSNTGEASTPRPQRYYVRDHSYPLPRNALAVTKLLDSGREEAVDHQEASLLVASVSEASNIVRRSSVGSH
jgi:hypothetical protein